MVLSTGPGPGSEAPAEQKRSFLRELEGPAGGGRGASWVIGASNREAARCGRVHPDTCQIVPVSGMARAPLLAEPVKNLGKLAGNHPTTNNKSFQSPCSPDHSALPVASQRGKTLVLESKGFYHSIWAFNGLAGHSRKNFYHLFQAAASLNGQQPYRKHLTESNRASPSV